MEPAQPAQRETLTFVAKHMIPRGPSGEVTLLKSLLPGKACTAFLLLHPSASLISWLLESWAISLLVFFLFLTIYLLGPAR